MAEGFIKKLALPKGFVFIAQNGGADIFAHRNDFDEQLEWNELLEGRRVRFDLDHDPRRKAINVRAAD